MRRTRIRTRESAESLSQSQSFVALLLDTASSCQEPRVNCLFSPLQLPVRLTLRNPSLFRNFLQRRLLIHLLLPHDLLNPLPDGNPTRRTRSFSGLTNQ